MANSLSVTVDGQNLLWTQKMFQLDKKCGKRLIEESSKKIPHARLILMLACLILVNGNYGFWSAWSDCDQTCGGGRRIRSRSCTNPPPQFGGSDCSTLGPLHQAEICNLNKCPVHGNYSNWSLWSPCSVTCGVGTVERQRYCTNPTPSPDGRNCDDQGPAAEKKSCELVECTGNPHFGNENIVY